MADVPLHPTAQAPGQKAGSDSGTRTGRYGTRGEPLRYGDPTTTALQLWEHLSKAHSAVHAQATNDLTQRGLTMAEYGVLEALHRKGPMQLGEIQRDQLVSSGGVTFLVDRLEAKGLVERHSSREDRRAKYAALTSQGEAMLAELLPAHAECIRDSLSGLSLPEQRSAIGILRALAREAAGRKGTPSGVT